MKGKNRCKILKDIRRRIAEENDITYVTTECKYKGDCLGTCPKCEAEVRYLEKELERRRSLGYKVTVAGLAATITLGAAGCTPDTETHLSNREFMGDIALPESSEVVETMGEAVDHESSDAVETSDELMGTPSEYVDDITGDIPVTDESELEIGELPEESDEMIAGMIPPPEETEAELMGDIAY